jgi:HEAT repeat protein
MPEFDFDTEVQQVDAVELESVKRLVQLLGSTLKSLLLYPANNPIPKEFKKKLYAGLGEFLDKYDELKLDVNSRRFLYRETPVYEEGEKEEGLVRKLHADGIRELAFLKGLESEELDGFLDVMEESLRQRDLDEDLVTMLWEKDLNNVKYLVVDDLMDVDVPAAEDVPDNWDFEQLLRSEIELAGQEADSAGKAYEDLSYRYKQEQTKELLRKLKEFSPEEVERIQQLLEMEDRRRTLDEFLDVLTEVLVAEEDVSEFREIMNAMNRVLDVLVNVADFHSAANIIRRLRNLESTLTEASGGKTQAVSEKVEMASQVIDRAGTEDNIKRISVVLNEKEMLDLTWVKRYLLSLGQSSVVPIIHQLGDLKELKTRKMVCEVLAEKARDRMELLREGLSDQRWYVVRNIISVIGVVGLEEGAKLLKPIAKHREVRVRKEIVASLIKIPGSQAGSLLISFLEDEDKKVRLLASRGLARKREQQAVPALVEMIKGEEFRDKTPDEKKSLLEGLAVIAGGEAIPFLVKVISKRRWLKRDKHNETRVLAIGALSLIDEPRAHEALSHLKKKRNRAIRQACEHALRRVQTRRARQGEKVRTV